MNSLASIYKSLQWRSWEQSPHLTLWQLFHSEQILILETATRSLGFSFLLFCFSVNFFLESEKVFLTSLELLFWQSRTNIRGNLNFNFWFLVKWKPIGGFFYYSDPLHTCCTIGSLFNMALKESSINYMLHSQRWCKLFIVEKGEG